MDNTDFDAERDYLKSVLEVIDRQLQHLVNQEAADRGSVAQAREDMWNETHIIRDLDDIIELSNQNREVSGATETYLMTSDELRKLRRMRQSPYFGRFDFTGGADASPEAIYIGIGNLMDEASYDIFVYDWRAPISSAFYEYDLGDALYETPNGIEHIHIVLKRQYKIENSELLYMYDTNSSMHDDILGEILSKNTSSKLKVIISSIQKEQNAAIRNPQNRLMLIYGTAGSGKTSVGLHRMAYILYHHRKTIKAGDIVVISNNAIFNSYISNILPDLGEEDVVRLVFHDLLKAMLEKGYTFENHIRQLQALSDDAGAVRTGAVRIKYSADFLSFCISYFKSFRFEVPELRYKDNIILSKADFQSKFNELRYSGYRALLDNIVDTIRQTYEHYFLVNKKAILSDIARDADHELSEQHVQYRYEARLQQHIQNAVSELTSSNGVEPLVQLKAVLRLYCEERGLSDALVLELCSAIEEKYLPYEDALLYFLVCVLMGEAEPRLNVAHVLLDEAQDYNLIQLYIIKALYPRSYFTLLADVNQSISDVTAISRYEDFELVFGAELQKFRLAKSYRSSGPINALAFQLMSRVDNQFSEKYSYFSRDGKMPCFIVTQDIAEAIASRLPDLSGYNTVGIVTMTEEDAALLYRALIRRFAIQLIADPQDKISERIVILPLVLAKGLEFDAVCLVKCFQDTGNEAPDRRRAYLACTRALHELYILDSAPLPSCFDDCAPYVETVSE